MTATTDRFVYRQPTPEQVKAITLLRELCQGLAANLEQTAMDPRCRALALTKLEEVSMWGNKGIVFAPTDETRAI